MIGIYAMTDSTKNEPDSLITEACNPLSMELDDLSPPEIINLINSEDSLEMGREDL